MKVKAEPKQDAFVPFDMVFTIESKNEAAGLYALFSNHYLCKAIHQVGLDHVQVREAIKTAMGRVPSHGTEASIINNRVVRGN